VSDPNRRAQPVPQPAPQPAPAPYYPPPQWQQPHWPPQPPAQPPAEVLADLIDRLPRRERRPSGLAELCSRTFAAFVGTFFGVLLAGVVLLLGVRWYLHWSVASTVEEMNRKLEEDRKANPPPKFEWPSMPTTPTGKK